MHTLQYPRGRFEPQASPLTPADRAERIERLARMPAGLRAAVAGLTDDQLDTRYRDGGWSPRQITHHVADSHLNAFVRIKLGLTQDSPRVTAYPQEIWAELDDVIGMPVEASLSIMDGVHARWDRVLRGMSDLDFARTIDHPEAGAQSLDFVLQLYDWHGAHHTAQILGLREREGW